MIARLRRFVHCLFRWHRAVDVYNQYYYADPELIRLECSCGQSFWTKPGLGITPLNDAQVRRVYQIVGVDPTEEPTPAEPVCEPVRKLQL